MMQTDVLATTLTADGNVYLGPARVKAVLVTCDGTASNVILNDGSVAKLTIVTPAAASIQNVLIPGEGIKFNTNITADFKDSHVTAVTVFYA